MRHVGQVFFTSGFRRLSFYSLLTSMILDFVIATPAHAVVRRRLNVNSNPAGALVYVDNQQIGTTPCSVDFTYYGTREIRLIKPGYETLTVNQPIPTPWYEYTPIDFVAENFLTTKIRDNRTVNYNLSPQLVVPVPELLDRANQLRQDTLQHGLAPPAGAVRLPTPVPGPVAGPGFPVGPPTVITPEPLPGINPPPGPQYIPQQPVPQQLVPQQMVPQPLPAPPPNGAPLLPPRL